MLFRQCQANKLHTSVEPKVRLLGLSWWREVFLLYSSLKLHSLLFPSGHGNWVNDIKLMLGFKPAVYWQISWMVIAPVAILVSFQVTPTVHKTKARRIALWPLTCKTHTHTHTHTQLPTLDHVHFSSKLFCTLHQLKIKQWVFFASLQFIIIFNAVIYTPVAYGKYVYPKWAEMIGWCFCLGSLICIPIGWAIVFQQKVGFKVNTQHLWSWMTNPKQGFGCRVILWAKLLPFRKFWPVAVLDQKFNC